MTDQSSQRRDPQWPESARNHDSAPGVPPSGYEPPRFVPPYGSGTPAPAYGQDAHSQESQPGNQYSQFGQQQAYGQQPPYGQPYSPYGQQAYYGAPAQPKTLSIASMVCGIASVIMGWLMLPQIAAVITGHMALRREPSGRGMSITGLVLGYLCLLGYGAFWLLLIIGLAYAGSTSTYTF